jgi:hypothetical protein
MQKKIYAAIALMVIILGAAIAVFAFQTFSTPKKEYAPGVNVGYTFTYSMKGYADLLDENASIPKNFYEVNLTDYYRVTITAVSDPIVNFTTTWRFTNGTQISNVGSVNIENGDSTEFWALYAANLTKGSLVRPLGTDGTIVNDTDTITYASGDRVRNMMQVEGQFTDVDDPTYSKMYMDYTVVYFDKITGMLDELRNTKIYNDPYILSRVVWKLEDTNAWQVS